MSASPSNSSVLYLGSEYPLKCGVIVPNRLVKGAMSECIADPETNLPDSGHIELYRKWAEGGIGMSITGNVQIDRRYMEAPRNVALESIDRTPERFIHYQKWAEAIKSNNGIAIMQISHPGRQCPMSVTTEPLAPSAVPLNLGLPSCVTPTFVAKAMSEADIKEVIERFATTAKLAVDAGFDGVQIHAAHGYLLSSFLSPLFNRRTDKYGGNAENRRRLLIEVVQSVRNAVGPQAVVCVKINSADFQKGGFDNEESVDVIKHLNELSIDFVEISGGTYENAVLVQNATKVERESTRKRLAFYIDFTDQLRAAAPDMPVCLTGGWRSAEGMHQAINTKRVDLIGLGRPILMNPSFANQLVSYSHSVAHTDSPLSPPIARPYELNLNLPIASVNKSCEAFLENLWHHEQMKLLIRGEMPDFNTGIARKLYCLSVPMFTGYIWEPRRNRKLARKIAATAAGVLAATAAVATTIGITA